MSIPDNIPESVSVIANRLSIPITPETIVDILTIVANPIRPDITGEATHDAALVMLAADQFAQAIQELDALAKQEG